MVSANFTMVDCDNLQTPQTSQSDERLVCERFYVAVKQSQFFQ